MRVCLLSVRCVLLQLLIDTWSPYNSLCKLPSAPLLGVTQHSSELVNCFTTLPQSATHVRLTFREIYCLDIHLRAGKCVAIRDGAYSLFDSSKVVEPLTPIAGLKVELKLHELSMCISVLQTCS